MGKFIQRIFTPSMTSQRRAATAANDQRRREQDAALARQMQTESEARAETENQILSARRAGRGRRLLMAATGEQGVRSQTLGG